MLFSALIKSARVFLRGGAVVDDLSSGPLLDYHNLRCLLLLLWLVLLLLQNTARTDNLLLVLTDSSVLWPHKLSDTFRGRSGEDALALCLLHWLVRAHRQRGALLGELEGCSRLI